MKHLIYIFAVCILTFSIIGNANAQVPNKISYQGLLTTSAGTPVQDGSYNLKFDIYNLPVGGILKYTETQTGIQISKGTFSVVLRPTSTIFAESLFVEVTALAGPSISSPVTFTPRSELTSSPYSLAPWVPSGSDIYYNSGNVGIGTTVPGANLEVAGQVKITGGSPGANKVLTSNANGLASWQTPSVVPSGVIVMWSGSLINIPSGWALCDGTNGTPDLRDRFIHGCSAGENPGATGGSTSHYHSMGNAEVKFGPMTGNAKITNRLTFSSPFILLGNTTNAIQFIAYGNEFLELSPKYLQLQGENTELASSLPPYFKLAFIIKL